MESGVTWSRNTGKYRIQRDLLEIAKPTRILDIGVVGTGPLDLWRELPLADMPVEVVGIDSDAGGIDAAAQLRPDLDLRAVSGYEIVREFGRDSFDLVVSTQVLEHVARPADVIRQVAEVLRPRGEFWGTLDSGHFSHGHAGNPLWKRLLRPLAARLSERYHDFGLTASAVETFMDDAGLELDELMHCNLAPVKPMVGRMNAPQAREIMPIWYALERELNSVADPAAFRGLYFRAHTSG